MTISHTPGLLIKEAGRSVGTQLTRVSLVQDGVDAATGGPILVLDSEGPSTFSFTHDDPADIIRVDDDENDLGALNIVLDASRKIVFYT